MHELGLTGTPRQLAGPPPRYVSSSIGYFLDPCGYRIGLGQGLLRTGRIAAAELGLGHRCQRLAHSVSVLNLSGGALGLCNFSSRGLGPGDQRQRAVLVRERRKFGIPLCFGKGFDGARTRRACERLPPGRVTLEWLHVRKVRPHEVSCIWCQARTRRGHGHRPVACRRSCCAGGAGWPARAPVGGY